jgi:ribosome-binding factor A
VGLARIYVSVFPFDRGGQVLEHLTANVSRVRGMLGHRVRSQFRVVPELVFHLDDSMEYVEHIDSLLK